MNNIFSLPQASPDAPGEKPVDESKTNATSEAEGYMQDLLAMARQSRSRVTFPRSPRVRIGPPEVEAAKLMVVDEAIQRSSLIAFRIFECFAYRTTLYYSRDDEMYYVVLFQRGELWYAIKTSALEVAECAFKRYEELLIELTENDVRRTQLEVRTIKLASLVESAERHNKAQREDIERIASQGRRTSEHLEKLRQDIAELESRRVAAQAQLNKLTRQSVQLNSTINNTGPRPVSRR